MQYAFTDLMHVAAASLITNHRENNKPVTNLPGIDNCHGHNETVETIVFFKEFICTSLFSG